MQRYVYVCEHVCKQEVDFRYFPQSLSTLLFWVLLELEICRRWLASVHQGSSCLWLPRRGIIDTSYWANSHTHTNTCMHVYMCILNSGSAYKRKHVVSVIFHLTQWCPVLFIFLKMPRLHFSTRLHAVPRYHIAFIGPLVDTRQGTLPG